MKRLSLMIAVLSALSATAQVKTTVKEFRQSGPFAVSQPFAIDTVDVQGNRFDDKSLLRADACPADLLR